ncbi:quinone oxidoreductase [Roseovarius sp. CAU 1744]|uniref:quinone oxidoreductase family protein n=1 Tax=Roseovarius sp. CAU 1744 TaxID=3140368 RepID=UPI00325BA5B4
MTKAVMIRKQGGPEVMELVELKLAAPQAHEVVLRHTAIGANLVDTYHRMNTTGQYAIETPAVLGFEAVGVVEDVGDAVENVSIGDRVAYCMVLGAYCERRIIAADQLVRIPDSVSDETAAACFIKGLTAQYLLSSTYKVGEGDTILIHAAAGGVGSIMSQWARHLGATVIGTVGSESKGRMAKANGCEHIIYYREVDFVEEVLRLTEGHGVDVVYDSVGVDTFEGSLKCIRPLGTLVNYGQASGPVPPFDISKLAANGSIFLAKPTLGTYIAQPGRQQRMSDSLFDMIERGIVSMEVSQTVRLENVQELHRDFEARRTSGSVVVIP